MVGPAETSIASQPCAASRRETSTVSSAVMPRGAQSTALTRTLMGLCSGQAARHASNTSSGNRMRFSIDPPYASVRSFVSGEMNEASR